MYIVDELNKPHVLVLEDNWDDAVSVWIRPDYESARLTLRAWLAIRILRFIELQDEDDRDSVSQEIAADHPDFATAPLLQINSWLIEHDVDCTVAILPVTASVDPLHEFAEKCLKSRTPVEQEHVRRKVIRAVGEELGWSEIKKYEKLGDDQLPLL
jgi:hypothetical protein